MVLICGGFVQQWVLPTEQVMGILTNANSVAVQECECRTHYRRCDKPLEVCFLLNKELVIEVLRQIEAAAQKVVHRFQIIDKPADFTDSPDGIEKMDAGYPGNTSATKFEIRRINGKDVFI